MEVPGPAKSHMNVNTLWHGCRVSGVHGDLYGSARTRKESREHKHRKQHSGTAVGCLGSTVICMEVHFT